MQQEVQVGFTLTVQPAVKTSQVSGVQRLDNNGRKAVIDPGCFGGHGSIAPTRGQQFEQVAGTNRHLFWVFGKGRK